PEASRAYRTRWHGPRSEGRGCVSMRARPGWPVQGLWVAPKDACAVGVWRAFLLGSCYLARSIACAIEAPIVPASPFSRRARRSKGLHHANAAHTAASAGAMAVLERPSRSGDMYYCRYDSNGMVSAASMAFWSCKDCWLRASNRACGAPPNGSASNLALVCWEWARVKPENELSKSRSITARTRAEGNRSGSCSKACAERSESL